MVNMLDDILTLGKVESGKLRFTPAPVNATDLCKNLVAEMKQGSETARRIVLLTIGEAGISAMDSSLLRHIVNNLLSNALKYSPDDSPVTLTVRTEPEQIIFIIKDRGIGIPDADQERLFETFHRAANAKGVPGTGLGLAIVKESVDQHGGTITIESQEGVGTTVTVALPRH